MEEQMILVKVAYGFSSFMEETWKENIHFIHLFIIENVELRMIDNG